MSIEDQIRQAIKETLDLKPSNRLDEAYVVQPAKFDLKTEFLSEKVKRARVKDFQEFVEALNEISARLDTADRENANAKSSTYRSLKLDEVHCLNAGFLRAYHFENIDDLKSQLSMDSITFMRIERDFGTFDDWQKDFIACAMSARSGYAMTAYNTHLKRYMNFIVDEEAVNVPIGTHPVIVLDVSEGAYYRDYVSDRKSYVIAMMKELDWGVIERRFKNAERISKTVATGKK